MRFAKEGYFLVIPALILDIWWHFYSLPTKYDPWLYFWVITFPTSVGILLLASFFRDPNRSPPINFEPNSQILSPADGNICAIDIEEQIMTFYIEMHYYNVHVVRAPTNVVVTDKIRCNGKHHLVYFIKKSKNNATKAIRKNARTIMHLETESKDKILYYMICGAFFRRSKPYVNVGDKIKAGDRMGMIVFGSTLKLTLPRSGFKSKVQIGDVVKAGQTILCEREEEK